MATNNIFFKIGSYFNGEGFQKARKEIDGINKNMRKGTEAASQMASMFGSLNTSASRSMVAMTGLMESILSFNKGAIASQAVMLAVTLYVSKLEKQTEAATKRANELKAACDKAFTSTMADSVKSMNAEVRTLTEEFDRITKQATSFAAALEGLRSASAQGGIAQLQVEQLQAMLDAHTEAEREAIQKSYDLQIAQAKLTEAEQAGAEKVNAALEAYTASKNRAAVIDEQMAVVLEERMKLEEAAEIAKLSNVQKYTEIQARVNELKAQEESLMTARLQQMQVADELEIKLETAKQQQETAVLQATQGVLNAQLAQKKLDEANEQLAQTTFNNVEAAQSKLEREQERETLTEEAARIQEEVNTASENVKKAQEDYANALKNFEQNFSASVIADAIASTFGGKKSSSGTIPVEVSKSVQTTVADEAVKNAIEGGLVNTVADADKVAREAARNARNDLNKGSGQRAQEAKKYQRLMEQNPKTWSTQDRDFAAKFKMIQDAQVGNKQKVEDAKDAVEKAKDEAKRSADNLKEIKEKLNSLGLK